MPAEKLQTPQKVKLCLLDFRYNLVDIDGVGVLKQLFEDEKAMTLMDEEVWENIVMFVDLNEKGYSINARSDEEWNEARAEWTVEVRPELINCIKEIMIKKNNNPSIVGNVLEDFVHKASSLPVH